MQTLSKRNFKLSWVGDAPQTENQIVMLVPQFNESSNGHFKARLEFFDRIAKETKGMMDVVVIDDGSNDDSLDLIKSFKKDHPDSFYAASVTPNLDKVGALYVTVLALDHEFVILSDFDTDLKGFDLLFDSLGQLKESDDIMGGYFRMLPHSGRGNVFLFQQLEYSMSRSCYQLYKKDNSVPVMPGAGCLYKRSHLVDIYKRHSGFRSGEDRESTSIGLRLGYKTIYMSTVLALTRPPQSYQTLIKQRIRWNSGYLETVLKERQFYVDEILKLSAIGIRSVADIIRVSCTLLVPVILLVFSLISWKLLAISFVASYTLCLFWAVNAIVISPHESLEFKNKRLGSILMYPFYKIPLEIISWTGAISAFIKNKQRRRHLAGSYMTTATVQNVAPREFVHP